MCTLGVCSGFMFTGVKTEHGALHFIPEAPGALHPKDWSATLIPEAPGALHPKDWSATLIPEALVSLHHKAWSATCHFQRHW
jgi:hypothetical protein